MKQRGKNKWSPIPEGQWPLWLPEGPHLDHTTNQMICIITRRPTYVHVNGLILNERIMCIVFFVVKIWMLDDISLKFG